MTGRVALASCSRWPTGRGDHAELAAALVSRGVPTEWVVWDDPSSDWAAFELVVLRETWDYPSKLSAFLDWLEWLSGVTAVANGAATVRWNHHKGYLLDLAAAGVPVVPTEVAGRGADAVDVLGGRRGDVVVKPAIGIGGDDATRGSPSDPEVVAQLDALCADGDALVQPYLSSIEMAGETSIVMFAGEVSHAVRKLPAGGEFRVHDHRGGRYAPVEASATQLEVARAACRAAVGITGEAPLYARADLVDDDQGLPLLMELELIEPSAYLHTVPSATATFAAAITARMT